MESGNENSASCRRALQEKLFRKLSQSREIGYHTNDCLIGVLIPHAERPAYAIWSASTRAPGNFGPALVYLIIWFVCVMCPPQLSDSLQRYSVTLSYGIQTLWIFFFFSFLHCSFLFLLGLLVLEACTIIDWVYGDQSKGPINTVIKLQLLLLLPSPPSPSPLSSSFGSLKSSIKYSLNVKWSTGWGKFGAPLGFHMTITENKTERRDGKKIRAQCLALC